MDQFDKKLSDALRDCDQFDTERNAARRKEIGKMAGGIFDRNIATAKYWTWGALVLETIIFIIAAEVALGSRDIKTVIIAAAVAILAYETTILMKLWFWTVHSRIKLQEDMKLLQLQIAELSQQPRSDAGGEES